MNSKSETLKKLIVPGIALTMLFSMFSFAWIAIDNISERRAGTEGFGHANATATMTSLSQKITTASDVNEASLSASDFIKRSSITLPNRRLTKSEMNTWKAEYKELDGANEVELEIVRLVNLERAAEGLSPVVIDDTLMMAARIKAQYMADLGYYSHTGVYGSPTKLARAVGFRGSVGENLYRSPKTTDRAMQGWMDSDSHRECIMHSDFDIIGVGVYLNENGVFHWAQMFSGKRYR